MKSLKLYIKGSAEIRNQPRGAEKPSGKEPHMSENETKFEKLEPILKDFIRDYEDDQEIDIGKLYATVKTALRTVHNS
jgi:hypothetical protein